MPLPAKRTLQTALVAFVLLSTVACDQASKSWARRSLAKSSVEAIGGHVQLVLTENHGAFLSLGSHYSSAVRAVVFTGLVAIVLISVAIGLIVKPHAFARALPIALILGGGFGNLIDRVSRSGAVTDFIFVSYGPLRTGIFNLADVYITAGVIALLFAVGRADARPT
jgi:signal peptidase II